MSKHTWRVTGADRSTGDDRVVTVDADDEEQATRRANRRGLVVKSATEVRHTTEEVGRHPDAAFTASGFRRLATAVGAAIVIVCLPLFYINAFYFAEAEPTQEQRFEEIAKTAILNKLRSPSTAEFSDVSVRDVGNTRWVVSGSVDAQNRFGAMVRGDFAVRLSGGGSVIRATIAMRE